jgi:hypothetical protein
MQSDPDFTAPPNLDDVLHRSSSRRTWRGRGLVAGATVLASVLLAAQFAGLRFLPQPAPPPVKYALALVSNVTWATFTLTQNGHTQVVGNRGAARFDLYERGASSSPPSLWLSALAPPFTPQTCRLVIPPAPSGTCALIRAAPQWRVLFPFTSSDLPAQEQASVTALVNASLAATQPTMTIPVGGHYALGDILSGSLITQVALTASLRTARAPADLIPDPACPDLCAPQDATQWTPSALDLWHVRVFVNQDWYFARTADGRAVGTAHENLIPHAIQFDLNYDAAQDTWLSAPPDQAVTLAVAVTQPLCDDGRQYVEELYFVPASSLAPYSPDPTSTDHGLNGCLLRLTPVHTGGAITFLWRTGQLYAADAAAHAVEPTLPVASTADLASFGTR